MLFPCLIQAGDPVFMLPFPGMDILFLEPEFDLSFGCFSRIGSMDQVAAGEDGEVVADRAGLQLPVDWSRRQSACTALMASEPSQIMATRWRGWLCTSPDRYRMAYLYGLRNGALQNPC